MLIVFDDNFCIENVINMIQCNRAWVNSVGNSSSGLDKYFINFGSSEVNLITLILFSNALYTNLPHVFTRRPSLINFLPSLDVASMRPMKIAWV